MGPSEPEAPAMGQPEPRGLTPHDHTNPCVAQNRTPPFRSNHCRGSLDSLRCLVYVWYERLAFALARAHGGLYSTGLRTTVDHVADNARPATAGDGGDGESSFQC